MNIAYNKTESFNFIKDLNANLSNKTRSNKAGTNKAGSIDDSVLINPDDITTIIDIVMYQNNFCLHTFDYRKSTGFAVYNMNDHDACKKNRPMLKFYEKNVDPRNVRRLCEIATEKHNAMKLAVIDKKAKPYIPHTNRPESYGLTFMKMLP